MTSELYETILLILAVFGLLQAFLGYYLFRVIAALNGFISGTIAGFIIGLIMDFGNSEEFFTFAFVIGLICAMFAYAAHLVGVFLSCFSGGSVLGTALLLYANLEDLIYGNVDLEEIVLFGILIGVLCGLIGILFAKPCIIFTTAAQGGSLLALVLSELGDGEIPPEAGLVLGLFGLGVQLYMAYAPKYDDTDAAAGSGLEDVPVLVDGPSPNKENSEEAHAQKKDSPSEKAVPSQQEDTHPKGILPQTTAPHEKPVSLRNDPPDSSQPARLNNTIPLRKDPPESPQVSDTVPVPRDTPPPPNSTIPLAGNVPERAIPDASALGATDPMERPGTGGSHYPAQPSFCFNCGYRIQPGMQFCPMCGEKLRF